VTALKRTAAQELMDDPSRPADELRVNLGDLGRIHRLLGTHAAVQAFLDRLVPLWRARRVPGAPLWVLDVATGGADIPLGIAAWATGRGIPVRIAAVDRHPVTAALARDHTVSRPEIHIVRADARALPLADQSIDACLCTLALHHLEPAEQLALLRRLDRAARLGFLVVDLVRSWGAYAGAWLLTRFSRNPLTRSDGPTSVRRACSWDEYRRLAAAAGIPHLELRRLSLFRVALERLG